MRGLKGLGSGLDVPVAVGVLCGCEGKREREGTRRLVLFSVRGPLSALLHSFIERGTIGLLSPS